MYKNNYIIVFSVRVFKKLFKCQITHKYENISNEELAEDSKDIFAFEWKDHPTVLVDSPSTKFH
jgi:hypothetical protein